MKNLPSYEDSQNTSEEYETQYFNFGRNVLKNCLSSLVETTLQTLIERAKAYFLSLDLNENLKIKVINKCSNLLKLLLSASQSSLEIINRDLDEYFNIPDNVLLPQDEIFSESVDEHEVEELNKELEKWKSNILALDATQAIMEKELVKTAVIKKHILVKEQQLLNTINALKAITFADDTNTGV